MNTSQKALNGMLRMLETGEAALRICLKKALQPGLRSILEAQLLEYQILACDARALATQRGWDPAETSPTALWFTGIGLRLGFCRHNTAPALAQQLIRQKTGETLSALKLLHRAPLSDRNLHILFQKAMDCENAAIRRLQEFL